MGIRHLGRLRDVARDALPAIFALFIIAVPLPASADPATATEPAANPQPSAQPGTRLVLLGTAGGPNIRVERSQPGNAIVVDGVPYVIDAGDGMSARLFEAGFSPQDVRALFLTHLHMDHMMGLAPFLGFRWINRAPAALPVYGPPGTGDVVSGAFRYLDIPASLHATALPPGLTLQQTVETHEVDTVEPRVIYSDDKVRVTAVENTHFLPGQARPYGHDRSYALRFDTATRSIVFTGDSGPSEAIDRLAKGADILVAETMDLDETLALIRQRYPAQQAQTGKMVSFMSQHHLLPEEIGKMATRAGVRMVVLTHFSPAPDGDRDMDRFGEMMKPFFKGVVVAGKDLLEL